MLRVLETSYPRETVAPATSAEDRLRLALSAGRFGTWQLDLTTHQLHCSHQCKANFGHPPEAQLDYAAFRRTIHPDDLLRVDAAIDEAIERRGDYEADHRCLWPDGTTHWINSRGRVVVEDGRPTRLVGVTLDITDRKQAEDDLRVSESRLAGQKAALELVVSGAPIEVVLERLVRTAQEQVGANSRVALFVVDRGGKHLRFGAAIGFPESYARALDGFEVTPRNPACGTAAYTGESVIVQDVTTDPLWLPYLDFAREHGIRSVWSLPIRTFHSSILGTLAVCQAEPSEPQAREIESLQLLTQTAALVLEQHRTAQERRDAQEEVERHRRQLETELADSKLLQRVSATLIREDDEHALYETIVDAAATIARSEFASLQMFCPERGEAGEFKLLAWRGLGDTASAFWQWVPPDGSSVCGQAMLRVERVIVPDVEACEFLAGTGNLATCRQIGIRAAQTTPLLSRAGQVIGMISTHWREPHQPSERDLRLLDIIARQAADLIERRSAADTLRASEERHRSILAVTTDVIWTTGRTGGFDTPQAAWTEHTGQAWEEHRGNGWLNAIHPEDRERVRRGWEAASARRSPHVSESRVWSARAGEYRHTISRGTPIFNADGTLREWVGSDTDVHEQKQLAESLKEAARRKDEFLATLAHELRNPLAPLRNGLQIVKLSAHDPATIERAVAMMDRQLSQMVRLIDDLLDVSRISLGKITLRAERVRLVDVVEQAVETCSPLVAEAGQALTLHVADRSLEVLADATRLAQVFANLLSNAVKFTGRGGQIEIGIECTAGLASVTVRDNGIGIVPDLLPRIFDLFTQLDSSLERTQGGLGIGLSLARWLVEMHGGRIEAHSAGLQQGSRFVVQLPIVAPAQVACSSAGQHGVRPQGDARRIMVVDDNLDAATSLALVLRLLGHDVDTAGSGLEVLQRAAEWHPDLILLDLGMPHMNGYDTARRIRAQPWGQRVLLVALTGWGQEQDRRLSREAGFDHHLVKPIEIETLEKLLHEVLPAHAAG
jgi:PAS domain S-box-containing protein